MIDLILDIIWLGAIGAVMGLFPMLLGRYLGKPNTGMLGLFCSIIGAVFGTLFSGWGVTGIIVSAVTAAGFIVALFVTRRDFQIRRDFDTGSYGGGQISPTMPAYGYQNQPNVGVNITCLSGPLKGRVYHVGANGLMFGRDNDCNVRFPNEAPGISRHHCCIRMEHGVPMLVDLRSTYGTFYGNGRQLSPNNPVRITSGCRFYLANTGYLFQVQ